MKKFFPLNQGVRNKMNENCRNTIILIVSVLLLMSSVYTLLIPSAYAQPLTTQQQGQAILNDVVGVDLTKYNTTSEQFPQTSYLGIVPQVNVQYTLQSNENNLKFLYTFQNGSLQIIHVLENGGTPLLKAVSDTSTTSSRSMAKEFLNNYQAYTGDSFYGHLESMLNLVNTSANSTIIEGNIQLDVTPTDSSTTFRWTYTYNGIQAPVKCVVLSYSNGFLKYFIDNWNLYTIGNNDINLSEKDAINNGIANAKTFSWTVGSDDNTYVVTDFNVTQAMIWETTFSNSLSTDTARDHNPLILYPMFDVWVSLDKFYPGNVYGIEVFYWADTKQLYYMQERSSVLDPSIDLTSPQSTINPNVQSSTVNNMPFSLFAISAFCAIAITPFAMRISKTKNRAQPKISKMSGLLLCVLLLLCILMLPVSSVTAINRNAIVWGSRSSGAYDAGLGATWRKTSTELSEQSSLAANIASMFSSYGGYISAHNYQGANSVKYQILGNISSAQSNYLFTAVIDFDHGVGNQYPSSYFHYMFEDDIGTRLGGPYPGTPAPSNGVYDYEVYANTGGSNQQSKVYFAYISTCMSSNITYQGLQADGLRVGMPYAWTHRNPLWIYTQGFTTQYDMSLFGYSQPDGGSYCYIGFSMGSPGLAQTGVESGYTQTKYSSFVAEFFAYALMYQYTVKDALDQASLMCFTRSFGQTDLYTGFTAIWPMYWSGSWHDTSYGTNADTMTVYGNGNMYLY
jgi:predicted PurR-regulated permease PerM